jgi:hypothetical protein
MKQSVFILLGIFMLASIVWPTMAMEDDEKGSGDIEIEILPRIVPLRECNNKIDALENCLTTLEDNHREKHENLERELEGVKLRLSHLEEFKGEVITAERNKSENKRAYKDAKISAKSWGRHVGAVTGILSGLGYTKALLFLVMPRDDKKKDIALSSVGFTGIYLLSHYFYRHDKNVYYRAFLRRNHDITAEQKVKLKKRFHKEEFRANTIATAATAVGLTAGILYGTSYLFPHKFVAVEKSTFWNIVPHAVMGIVGLKWLTYTGMRSYKKWSRGNQPR